MGLEARGTQREAAPKNFEGVRSLGEANPEAADVVACWDLEKCGFSLFIGSTIGANERERLARLLRYLMRSPVSFKRLRYDERTGKVEMCLKHDQTKVFNHAVDFLAALARHVPKARQQTVTYAGHYANATGNLSRKPDEVEEAKEEQPKSGRYIPWNLPAGSATSSVAIP